MIFINMYSSRLELNEENNERQAKSFHIALSLMSTTNKLLILIMY